MNAPEAPAAMEAGRVTRDQSMSEGAGNWQWGFDNRCEVLVG
jgi:hypothetical protein